MHEVFTEAIQWVNLPFTILLGLVILYWLLVALGALDSDLFGDAGGVGDIHADFDAHLHVDANSDLHIDGDSTHLHTDGGHAHLEHGPGFFNSALSFLNVGKVPVMFVFSVLALCLWLGSMIANHYFTGGSIILASMALLPNLILSVVATRYITYPFRPVFRALSRDRDEKFEIIGRRCIVVTSEATPEFGQAEIATDGVPLLLNVRTMNETRLVKGEPAVVVRTDADRGIHFITPIPNPTPNH